MPVNSESLKRVLLKMKGFARGERAKTLGSRLFPAKQEAAHMESPAEEGAEAPAHEAAESPDMEAEEHAGEEVAEGADDELEMAKKLLALLK
jgi:hypothetical protein